MTHTPHAHLQEVADAAAAGDSSALRDALEQITPADRQVVTHLVEQLERVVATISAIGEAITMLSQCDDLREAQLNLHAKRLELLEATVYPAASGTHSRRAG